MFTEVKERGRKRVRPSGWFAIYLGALTALAIAAFVLALLSYLRPCSCAQGANATVTVTIINTANDTTNVTEIIYNTTQFNMYINISDNGTSIVGPQGPAGPQGPIGPQGPTGGDGTNGTCTPCTNGRNGTDGANGTCTPCTNGRNGTDGANGTCTPCTNGRNGTDGANGTCIPCTNGTNGTCTPCTNGTNGLVGGAEFIRTIQSPNDSVPPGTAFTIDSTVFNSLSANVVPSAGAGGTVFTLTPGVYVIDYEASLAAASSIGLYVGATAGSLALDTNTIAGSTTGTTWIHGRTLRNVTLAAPVLALSSVVGTAAIVTAGTAAGFYVVRMSFVQLA